ncbi:MAG: flagellar hook basal-body protein [Terricaulis sp.]
MTQGLLELGEILLSNSQRRLESVARNIANTATPGFRAERLYEEILASQANTEGDSVSPERRTVIATDFAQASLQLTGASLDLAIAGEGFFEVRDGDALSYVRSAHFERDTEGRLVDGAGRALQALNGGDIFVADRAVEILADGTVMQDGVPLARIKVVAPADLHSLVSLGGALFAAPDDAMAPVEEPLVRQGMIESSNVETAEEMLQMMTAIRQAETGARIVQAYDGLIGQAITSLGRTQR